MFDLTIFPDISGDCHVHIESGFSSNCLALTCLPTAKPIDLEWMQLLTLSCMPNWFHFWDHVRWQRKTSSNADLHFPRTPWEDSWWRAWQTCPKGMTVVNTSACEEANDIFLVSWLASETVWDPKAQQRSSRDLKTMTPALRYKILAHFLVQWLFLGSFFSGPPMPSNQVQFHHRVPTDCLWDYMRYSWCRQCGRQLLLLNIAFHICGTRLVTSQPHLSWQVEQELNLSSDFLGEPWHDWLTL